MTKRVVWAAKSEAEKDKFSDIGPNGDGIFRLCKQLDHENQDVVGEKCVRNNKGELLLSNEEKMKAWAEHYVPAAPKPPARALNYIFSPVQLSI